MNNQENMTFKQRCFNFWKSDGMKKFRATLLAIGIGLFIGFIVMLITKPNMSLSGLGALLFGGISRFDDVLFFMVPVLMTGLSVGFAFKMGLFNIGASGQFTMGMFFTLFVVFVVPLPSGIHVIVAILAGILGGLLWGLIPGILKAFSNVNEVITSIMLNYIGMFIVDSLIKSNNAIYNTDVSNTRYIPKALQLASFGASTKVNIGLIIGIAVAIIVGLVMYKTTFGYELIATGYSKEASKYAGINYKRNTVLTMGIAGGLAGLGGSLMILSPSILIGSSMVYAPINVVSSAGFNGIAVALLGSSNPFGIIFSSLFISYIQRGGTAVALLDFETEIVDAIIAIIIYFSAFVLIINQAISEFIKRKRNKKDVPIVDVSNETNQQEVA